MKNLTKSVLLWGLLSTLTYSCSDENEPAPQPKPAEEQVKEIVKELEKKPELTKFTEELKKIDVANVETEELTVFAVKNDAWNKVQTRAESTNDIKRHIAKGSYAPEELKDSMVLTSISNDQLFVTRTGNDIAINGVGIETNGTKVGKSYVYTVPEVIPVRQDTVTRVYTTTINVFRCNPNWSVEDNVEGRPISKATVEIYEVSDVPKKAAWKILETDGNGQVTFTHTQTDLEFKAYAGDSLTNVYNGFMVEGIFTSQKEIDESHVSYPDGVKPGSYKLRDLNGDGVINDADKVSEAVPYVIHYDTVYDTHKEFKIFLTSGGLEVPDDNTEDSAIKQLLTHHKAMFANYMDELIKADNELLSKENYPNKVKNFSENIWRKSYQQIHAVMEIRDALSNAGLPSSALAELEQNYEDMQVEMALAYSNLVNFYGGAYVLKSSKDSVVQVIDTDNVMAELDRLANILPPQKAMAVRCAIARVSMNGKKADYHKVVDVCNYIIESNKYSLPDKGENTSTTESNKEVIWGGYEIMNYPKGRYYHAAKYSEVLLMQAQAYLELNDNAKAVDTINMFLTRDGKENVSMGKSTDELKQILNSLWMENENMTYEGLGYAHLRSAGIFTSTLEGVDKHFQLLPIPESVLTEGVEQNPGY